MGADLAIYGVLSSTPAAMAALGNRIYVDILPETATVPAAVVALIDGIPIQGVRHESGWVRSRVQVDVYAKTRANIESAVAAIKTALRRYQGVVGAATVDDIMLDSERSDFSVDAEVRLYSLDFVVYHKE